MTINKISLNESEKLHPNKYLSYEKVAATVMAMQLGENTTTALLNKARAIPPGALNHFLENIQTHIANLNKVSNGKTN